MRYNYKINKINSRHSNTGWPKNASIGLPATLRRVTLIALISFLLPFNPLSAQSKPVLGKLEPHGMVVCARKEAAEIGADILKKGGNAVDAAIAVQFALAVCYPEAGNIGGGGFMVFRSKDGSTSALDFREKAPIKSTRDMYLDGKNAVVDDLSVYGILACGVPGTVDGMIAAHDKYGHLPMREIMEPAILLAEMGFSLTSRQAESFNYHRDRFIRINGMDCPLVKTGNWVAGDTLRLPKLAETLRRIQRLGRDGFYAGVTAQAILDRVKHDKGLISSDDLSGYKAIWRKPIAFNYKSFRIISMPPPSSGGIALQQLFGMIEPYPIESWGWNSAKTAQLITETERRVYADRATYLGDPDFVKVPVNALTDPVYLKRRMSTFSMDKASASDSIKAGQVTGFSESEETTHFSVVDGEGNAVAITTTLNGAYGSLVFITEAGFFLNNQMDDFSIKPGYPNMYGLVGGDANAVAPGKRMLSSMTPAIVEKNHKLLMVVGSPGGSTIITTVFQVILNVADFQMTMQEAVNAGRFHHQWLPDQIDIEQNTFSASVLSRLHSLGYKTREREAIGRVDAIRVMAGGSLEGAPDGRGDDAAAGY